MSSVSVEFMNSQIRKLVGDDFDRSYIFVEPFSMGDAILDLALLKKFKETNNCNIIFITSPYVRRIEEVFKGIVDKWIAIDDSMLLMCYAEVCCKMYDLHLGNVICMAPSLYDGPFGKFNYHVNEAYLKKSILGLDGNETLSLKASASNKELTVDNENFVLIIPHAQSAEFLGVPFWQKCIDSLADRYHVFVDDFSERLTDLKRCEIVRLSLSDIVNYHGMSAHTISYRSGVSDLIATCGKAHHVIYPIREKLKFGFSKIKSIQNASTLKSGFGLGEISMWNAPNNEEIFSELKKL